MCYVQRSTSNGSRHHRSRKNRGRDHSSESRSGDYDEGSGSESGSVSPSPRRSKKVKKLKTGSKKTPAADSEASSAKVNAGGDYEESDPTDYDSSILQQSAAGGKASRAGLRSAVSAVDKPTASAAKRLAGQKLTSLDDDVEVL